MTRFSERNLQAFRNIKKPDAIIFDWDNTLVDTWPLIHLAINQTMAHMNQELWSLEKIRDTVHKSMRESFPDIFGSNWEKAGEFYRQSYHQLNIENIAFLKDSLNLIKLIHQLNIPQFIVSNKIGATLRKEVKKLQVDKLFFSIIGAQDADADKPSSSPVELALMSSGIDLKKHHLWFVGDTIADIECAYNIGATPILYGFEGNKIS